MEISFAAMCVLGSECVVMVSNDNARDAIHQSAASETEAFAVLPA